MPHLLRTLSHHRAAVGSRRTPVLIGLTFGMALAACGGGAGPAERGAQASAGMAAVDTSASPHAGQPGAASRATQLGGGRGVGGAPDSTLVATVYKTPTCGCCRAWVDHLTANGFRVTTIDREDLAPIKAEHGVGEHLASCHTALIGGYVVEGHVPVADVWRLLRERPAIAGIAAPGMPSGSPGMEMPGAPADRYDVVSFDRAGVTRVFASH